MNTKKILASLGLVASFCFLPLACGDVGETTSTVTSGSSSSGEGNMGGMGQGGEGGKTTSSSSSGQAGMGGNGGQGGTMVCQEQKTCDYCLFNSCSETDECMEEQEFWKYQDIANCLILSGFTLPQSTCPACEKYGIDGTIDEACLTCAARNSYNPPCELSCEKCGTFDVLAACELCAKDGGCDPANPNFHCLDGQIAYSYMLTCLQQPLVLANCPACVGKKIGDPIDPVCQSCAKDYIVPECRVITCPVALGLPD